MSASFATTESSKAAVGKYVAHSSYYRAGVAAEQTKFCGCYGTMVHPVRGIRVIPLLLPTKGMDDASGNETDVFVVTASNNPLRESFFTIDRDEFTASTIRLVTEAFLATLPKKWPRGEVFDGSDARVHDDIKKLLPDQAGRYACIFTPNTLPIPVGQAQLAQGSPNKSMSDMFQEMTPFGQPWLAITTNTNAGVVPFSAELQMLVQTHKATLGPLYPKQRGAVIFADTPQLTLRQTAADIDADDPIAEPIDTIRAKLDQCRARNAPPSPPRANQPPTSITMDADGSQGSLDEKPSSATSVGELNRIIAMLRLRTASWDGKTNTVGVFDIKDTMQGALALSQKQQPAAISNLFEATSNRLSDTLDFVNRSADWPVTYRSTQ